MDLLKNLDNMEENQEVLNALKILEKNGYYVNNLWNISDVQTKFECDKDEAFEILDKAVAGEWIIEEINNRIYRECGNENFIEIR